MDQAREHVDRLDQRCRWLTARIAAKRSVGWDVTYDTSERDALRWALEHLREVLCAKTTTGPRDRVD